ncbi:TPA: hypothetical protein MD305_005462, partial [Klebsiella pneumoniae]|nr:hypothetical protein [Klebsiella pneumoniae]HBX9661735.1 hypothetical protein [Klebsiella pneumoniae]
MPVFPRSPGVNASLPPAASVSRPVWYGTGGFFRSGPASLRVYASPSP